MNKTILNYINKCEGWKRNIKGLHWNSKNLSQHKLCDDIADAISEFEDLVSEIEQSISGKLNTNAFSPTKSKETSLKVFVEGVISDSQRFLKKLDKMGKEYVGIKSECETFIGTMQRNLYLVNFTLKEDLKRRLRNELNESKKGEIRLSEAELKGILHEGVARALRNIMEMNELYSDWYDEEDYSGNIGEEGMVRSYDIGTYYVDQAEEDAMENGYGDDVAGYLEYWFSEIQSDCPWYWQKVGSGYGYNGKTIFSNDGIVCKDIFGQIMVDEYPIGDARRNQRG